MDITYCSKDCFKVSTKTSNITVNPQKDDTKHQDVVLLSKATDELKADGAIKFDGPGEYEVKGTMVDGVDLSEGLTGFALTADGMRFGYLPEGVESLNDQQLEAYGTIDILCVPIVGDKAEATNKLITQFEPRIIIPYNYSSAQFDLLSAEFGGEVEKLDKLKILAKDLPVDHQKLIALK